MKVWFASIMCLFMLIFTQLAYAQTVVYQDDFEGSVSGWSVNDTDFDPDTTTFLGPFDVNGTSTSRTFNVPAGSTQLVIEFDLYRFDSWDNFAMFGFDRFEIDIDGTQIFSLPFPNPQASRSGTTGNVDWTHSPLTGTVEVAYESGQFWFDQLHRFEVIVNNPGATVDLTLRADLSQPFTDESAAFDNFLVTADPPTTGGNTIIAVAETFSPIDGTAGGVTTSVLASDTINGVILNPNDVTITATSPSSPNVTLDQNTGLITVAAGTPAGVYTVKYEICENIDLTNCSSVTETVTVEDSPPSGGGGGVCPAGTVATPGTFHVASATGGNSPNLTIGQPQAEGSIQTNGAVTFFGPITMDLTGDPNILVPEGELIEVVLSSHFGTSARAEILMSADGVNYTSLGTTGNGGSVYGAWQSNILRYDDFIVPAGGARFLQVMHQASGVRADGVIYNTQCQPGATPPVIVATDENQTVPSSASAQPAVLNVVTNDAFDGVTPSAFDLALNSASILPPELTFDLTTGDVGVAAAAPAGVYSFDYDICEVGTTNCDTATVTITIEPPVIEAIAETFPPIDGTAGGVTTSVLASDTLDGAAVNPADITLTVGTSDPELTLDPATGLITVAAGTSARTYTVDYTICENLNPTNCSTITETVTVEVAQPSLSIDKVANSSGPFTAGDVVTYTYTVTNNGDTIIRDIVINDTHNGSDPAPIPGNETLFTDGGTAGDSTDATIDGSWDVLAPGDTITFTGTYTITQIDAANL